MQEYVAVLCSKGMLLVHIQVVYQCPRLFFSWLPGLWPSACTGAGGYCLRRQHFVFAELPKVYVSILPTEWHQHIENAPKLGITLQLGKGAPHLILTLCHWLQLYEPDSLDDSPSRLLIILSISQQFGCKASVGDHVKCLDNVQFYSMHYSS